MPSINGFYYQTWSGFPSITESDYVSLWGVEDGMPLLHPGKRPISPECSGVPDPDGPNSIPWTIRFKQKQRLWSVDFVKLRRAWLKLRNATRSPTYTQDYDFLHPDVTCLQVSGVTFYPSLPDWDDFLTSTTSEVARAFRNRPGTINAHGVIGDVDYRLGLDAGILDPMDFDSNPTHTTNSSFRYLPVSAGRRILPGTTTPRRIFALGLALAIPPNVIHTEEWNWRLSEILHTNEVRLTFSLKTGEIRIRGLAFALLSGGNETIPAGFHIVRSPAPATLFRWNHEHCIDLCYSLRTGERYYWVHPNSGGF